MAYTLVKRHLVAYSLLHMEGNYGGSIKLQQRKLLKLGISKILTCSKHEFWAGRRPGNVDKQVKLDDLITGKCTLMENCIS